MKKGLILFVALTLLTAVGAFAKVTVVKDGDNAKVTWTYTNADAGSVSVVGDFQGWKLAEGKALTKGADGVWTVTLDFKASDFIKYKFNVDGEWTEDPEAPAGTDDGFGGTNGYIDVAALSAGAAAGAPASYAFGNYSSARFVAYSAGAANDKVKVDFRIKSYWKLDNVKLFEGLSLKHMEIAVDNASYTFYDGTAAAGHEYDKAYLLGQWILSPLNSNAAKTPYLGHFGLVLDTGVAGELGYYTHFAKPAGAGSATYYYVNFADQDSLGGLLQLSKKSVELGGMKLDYLFAVGSGARQAVDGKLANQWSSSTEFTSWNGGVPNGRWAWDGGMSLNIENDQYTGGKDWWYGQKGFYATKGEVDLTVGAHTFGLILNTGSSVAWGEDLTKYGDKVSYELGLGGKGKLGDLSYTAQLVAPFYYNYTFDAGKFLMLGGNLKYSSSGFSTTLDASILGRYLSRDAFWQKNDADSGKRYEWENRGLMTVAFNNAYETSAFKVGADLTAYMINPLYDLTGDKWGNSDAGSNNKNSPALVLNATDIVIQPLFNYNVSKDLTVGTRLFLDYLSYNKTAPNNQVPFEFQGAGVFVKTGELAFLKSLTASYKLLSANATHITGTDLSAMANQVLVSAGLPDDMGLNIGFVSRGGKVYEGSKVATGFGLGFSKKFNGAKFYGPQFFLNYTSNYDINDSFDEKADLKLSNDYYIDNGRATVGAGNAATWALATGFKWDF